MPRTGRVIKLGTDDSITTIEGVRFAYPHLAHDVGLKGYIERVTPTGFTPFNESRSYETGYIVMMVDEDGRGKNLPLNKNASLLYGTHRHGQPIVGDAFILGEGFIYDDDEPGVDFTGLPLDATEDAVRGLIRIAINEAVATATPIVVTDPPPFA